MSAAVSYLARLSRPTSMLAALLTVFMSASAVAAFYGLPRSPDTTRQPNFLVIDIDVYAWDHVGVVREGVSNTPNLDALAARGVRFTQAVSHSGWTLPALSSLLSGALPVPGRAESRGIPWFPGQTQVLPDILGYYGYTTVAFFGYGVAGSAPFQSRFQHVDVTDVPPGAPKPDPPTDHVLAFLADAPSPFFALVHDANLHNVHLYDKEDADDPIPPLASGEPAPLYSRIYATLTPTLGAAAAQDAIKRHYDRMAGYYDEAIGRILAQLEADGLADDTVVIVTSDHGDDFFEHADVAHGLLYDSTIRVPLIIYDPRASRVGATESTVVQLSDLAPTVLARVGIPVAYSMSGRSLLSLLGDDTAEPYTPRPVFSITSACHVSWRTEHAKLMIRDGAGGDEWYPPGGSNRIKVGLADFVQSRGLTTLPLPDCAKNATAWLEYYDLDADPGERINCVNDAPDDAAALLVPLLQTLDERTRTLAGTHVEALPAADVARMREQGYWGLVDPTSAGAHAPGEGAPAGPR